MGAINPTTNSNPVYSQSRDNIKTVYDSLLVLFVGDYVKRGPRRYLSITCRAGRECGRKHDKLIIWMAYIMIFPVKFSTGVTLVFIQRYFNMIIILWCVSILFNAVWCHTSEPGSSRVTVAPDFIFFLSFFPPWQYEEKLRNAKYW